MTRMNQSPLGSRLDRRSLVAGLVVAPALVGAALAAPRGARAQEEELRIGFQKGSANLLVLKSRGDLEGRLGELGYTVSWAEFTSGPPLLEAMNAGSLDFGTTGAPPPIFAQAAGTDLIYALATTPSPRTQAIIVPTDSAIEDPEGLKGKKVAVAKGSSAHALLIRALQSTGLVWEDVEPIYLQPADAKAAFEGGSVDAWAIWDPYYAAEEAATGAKTIATNESVGTPDRGFYLASRSFAAEQAPALDVLQTALEETAAWANDNPAEVAQLVSAETGTPEATLLRVEERRVYGVEPITAEILADQQDLADLFYELALIPERLTVADATLAGTDTAGT